jgi:uncharacterized protein YjbJ (UPF0337 family)
MGTNAHCNTQETSTDKAHIKGAAEQAKGVNKTVGRVLGDSKLETEGKAVRRKARSGTRSAA